MASKKKEKIAVAELVTGKAEIIAYSIKCVKKGPKIGLVGMSHGTEYIGAKIIDKLFQDIDEKEVNGEIFAIPIANPIAVSGKSNTLPFGFGEKISPINLNSQYPGDPTGGLTQNLAKTIFDYMKKMDYVIDIHSGSLFGEIHPQARIRTDKGIKSQTIKTARELAKYSGIEFIVETKTSDFSKSRMGLLNTQAMLHGIPSVTLELFGGYVSKEDVNTGVYVLQNIMKGIGILNGTLKKVKHKTFRKLIKLYSSQAGVIEFVKELGEEVKKGEVYANIKNLLTGKTAKLIAPSKGILGFRVSFGIVNKGDYIGEFLSEK